MCLGIFTVQYDATCFTVHYQMFMKQNIAEVSAFDTVSVLV